MITSRLCFPASWGSVSFPSPSLPGAHRRVVPLREGRISGVGPAVWGAWLTQPCCPQEERPPYNRSKKGGSVGSVCYLSMGMVVLLMGLVFASVYIYRYFFLAQVGS